MPEVSTDSVSALVALLVENPEFANQLRTLHSLALYESGDARLGRDEKQALQNAAHFADLLDDIPIDELKELL